MSAKREGPKAPREVIRPLPESSERMRRFWNLIRENIYHRRYSEAPHMNGKDFSIFIIAGVVEVCCLFILLLIIKHSVFICAMDGAC